MTRPLRTFGLLVAMWVVWPAAALGAPLAPQMHTLASGIGTARSVAELPGGGFLYVDSANNLVREVSAPGKSPVTVAGNGTTTDVDGGPAINSGLNNPVSVAPLPDGGFLITEYAGSVVRMVGPDGTISTIAGTGSPSANTTAAGPATSIGLDYPSDAEVTSDGSILIADTYNNVIRDVSPSGEMTIIAGGGGCNDATAACDGMPAASVSLNHPDSVSPIQGGSGGYLIAEYDNAAIREISQVASSGIFTTVAGSPGQSGYGGDGGPATGALLDHPEQVMSTPDGGFLIADTNNERVRDVSPGGVITTVAGNGVATFAGDGGDATAASLDGPAGVSLTSDGGFLVADADNGAIRAVSIPPTTTISFTPTGNNGWFDSAALVTVTSTNAKTVNCQADPIQAPPAFDAIPAGCPFKGKGGTITGDGAHMIYAAGVDALGDKEIPVSATVNIDTTPPTLTCVGAPKFVIGARNAFAYATVSDQLSGPATPMASASVDTSYLGQYGVTVGGYDNAGNLGRVGCEYTILPRKLSPTPRLRWRFSPSGGNASVARLIVSQVPARAAVNVVCEGGGCPFSVKRDVGGAKAKGARKGGRPRTVDLTALFARASLKAGATLAVSVTEPNAVGRLWRFTFASRGRASAKIACLQPSSLTARQKCA